MFSDSKGYLGCPQESGLVDGGDTAVREGLVAIFGQKNKILDLVSADGICVRNPWQQPWNNPNNFTKDQLKCLVAGLYSIGRLDLCLKIYKAHEARGFCQNSERDWPGSTKLSRPHAFYKDSKELQSDGVLVIDSKSVPMEFSWRKFGFVVPAGEFTGDGIIETKLFDHSDILLPNDWEFLKVAAGLKQPGGFGLWWHIQSIKAHAKSDHNEENQMFAECVVLGTLEQYVKLNPNYWSRSAKYWFERNEIEYHNLTMQYIQERRAGSNV